MVDLGNMWGIEVVVIDENTKIEEFKKAAHVVGCHLEAQINR